MASTKTKTPLVKDPSLASSYIPYKLFGIFKKYNMDTNARVVKEALNNIFEEDDLPNECPDFIRGLIAYYEQHPDIQMSSDCSYYCGVMLFLNMLGENNKEHNYQIGSSYLKKGIAQGDEMSLYALCWYSMGRGCYAEDIDKYIKQAKELDSEIGNLLYEMRCFYEPKPKF